MIKAVFFDIDGTLVTRRAVPLPSSVAGLAQLKEKGILRGIATGRGPSHLAHHIKALKMDFYVTFNGQYVYTDKGVVYANPFTADLVQRLAEFATTEQRHLLFGSATKMEGSPLMTFGEKPWAKRLQRFLPRGRFLKQLHPLFKRFTHSSQKIDYRELAILQEPIYQCVLICPVEDQAALEARFPECKVTRSNPYTVDLILKNTSKRTGIEMLGKTRGFSLEQVMAFGDSWNDLEMLSAAKIGVAMGNAEPDLQAVADYVTASNEADGIYLALQHYRLIEEEEERA